ncbi:MAG: penicillin acylase family protein [Bryobacterales bacterium]
MYRFRRHPFPAWITLLLLCSACNPQASENEYQARIRRTSYGVAHIEANDLANLGFGEAYAHAEDHACTLADIIVMVRGERAKYFGRGENNAHLLNDIGIKALRIRERAAEDLRRQPEEIQQWFAGYAAGYNRYLEQTAKDKLPGWCRGADWVFPMTVEDLAAWHRASILQMPAAMVASAQPPATAPPAVARTAAPPATARAAEPPAIAEWAMVKHPSSSNGWALGKDLTESGRGMLLANPHYLWVGALRFWEKHLVIPGKLNVYGAHVLGIPGVAIGFNEAVGWTHTISAGERSTFYTLDLVPGKPTTYRYDGGEREMESRPVSVEVREQDGTLTSVEHTAYFSHYGPVVNFPGMGWTAERALAMRSANWDNEESWRQWLEMNRARGMSEFQQAHASHQGLGYVNTIAASADGVAWFADTSATPNLRPEAIDAWKQRRDSDPLTKQFWQRGLVLLDGGNPLFEWADDAGARDPGVVAYAKMPQTERSDYVFNANDSYWLTNSKALLNGPYSPFHGEPGTAVSLRTRQNDLHLSNRASNHPAGEDGKFNLDEIAQAVLSNRGLAAALIQPDLVARCRQQPSAALGAERIDLTAACGVLEKWDGRYDLESRGAVLFREFIAQYESADFLDKGRLFAVGFDPADPINTPRQLAPAAANGDLALENLARAVKLLQAQNIALDVPLGELQYANKPGRRVPIHGGHGSYEGILNLEQSTTNNTTLEPLELPKRIEGSRFLTEKGYPIATGASFLMVLEYTAAGPHAKAFLTYGQSGDPESENYFDQTVHFSEKQWRPVLFQEEEIAADVQREYTVQGPR